MPERFLSSEEYDEEAHKLYDDGDYDGALEMLKEGLSLYPTAVDLYVGLGYARLAREEYAWARRAFERAVLLDPTHDDALVGLGEALLRFGEREKALELFGQVAAAGYDDDIELMLTIGRALYRAALYSECRDVFAQGAASRPENAEVAASLGYALHRLGDDVGAGRQIRRALRLDPDLHEARIYLGHLLYDRGDGEAALRELERVPPTEHWDPLAVWRLIELKRTVWGIDPGDAALAPWDQRLRELEDLEDPVDRLLSEIEARAEEAEGGGFDPGQLELFERGGDGPGAPSWIVRLGDGRRLQGTWTEIVRQMRDLAGFAHESLGQYMRRLAERWHEQNGVEVAWSDPETFLRGAIAAGLIRLETEHER